ncbi:MAG TPA: SurA N-terminal domain-containing protein [Casimicrobiaceae bacterium]|nr:SurA N-terminal domain-containing protein [Casimicrobiaceae bacterium]
MFETVHKHKRLAQIVLALLIIPFAFFGVDSYFRRDGVQAPVATVGGTEITRAEFDELVRQQQDRMRAAMGRGYDPAIFDNPEIRFSLVEQLVSQRLLQQKARDENFRVTDADLGRVIGDIEAFRVDGKFSPERYRQLLAAQNMTPAMFEQRMRADVLLSPLQDPLAAANIVPRAAADRFVSLIEQQRDVATASIDPNAFMGQVKVDDAAVKAFYDQNPALFQIPEQARIEYVVLTLPALAAKVSVDAGDLKKQYDANIANYTKAEERSASHMLVAVKPDAKDEEKAAARKKAEGLARDARANPAKFAELAKANSEDPGSASQGGDLGSFARGSMVKPFEDAVFGAKPGEIIGPIETDFGYHIIRVGKIEAGRTRTFEEARPELELQLRQQRAQAKFAEAADQMQNLVYEQADSLAPVAKALDLPVQTTPFIGRAHAEKLALGSTKFVQSLFSPESVQAKRNTEAIEVGPNALMAGRVVEHKPAAPRPFDEVRDDIRKQLVARNASELAQQAGRQKLELLEKGRSEREAALAFAKPVTLTRTQPPAGFTPEAVTRIFQVDPAKVPQYVGAPNEKGGFSIHKLVAVKAAPAADAKRIESVSTQLGEQIGRELVNAYVATLKGRADVKINQQALEKSR